MGSVTVPVVTSSSSVKACGPELRIVSAVPSRLQGGITAATRDPSGKPRIQDGLFFGDVVPQ